MHIYLDLVAKHIDRVSSHQIERHFGVHEVNDGDVHAFLRLRVLDLEHLFNLTKLAHEVLNLLLRDLYEFGSG